MKEVSNGIVFFKADSVWHFRVDDIVKLNAPGYEQYEVRIQNRDGSFGYQIVANEEWERARKLAEG